MLDWLIDNKLHLHSAEIRIKTVQADDQWIEEKHVGLVYVIINSF
jgi:hypothetical protein